MKRLNWKKVALVVFPVIIFFSLSVALGYFLFGSKSDGTTATEEHSLEALVSYSEGTVEYRNEGEGWYEVNSNDIMLDQGSQVRVLGEGKAVINFEDGSLIRLASDTQVRLNTLEEDHIQILNENGETYSRVIPDEGRIYEVVNEDSTYTALGTAFKTINTEDKQGVEVYHSKVTVEGVNTDGELLVEQGNKYYIVDLDHPEVEGKVTEISIEDVKGDEFTVWNKAEDETYAEFKESMGVLFDIEPPALKLSAPANETKTLESSILVTGGVESGSKVLINGIEVATTEGAFSHEVALNEGANSIKVEAVDEAGNKTVITKVVIKETPPPPTPKVTNPPVYTGISLYGTAVDGGVSLNWNVSGVDTSNGFKIVWNKTGNPVFGVDNAKYISDGSTRSMTVPIDAKSGKTLYFKVCRYVPDGHTCDNYSNQIAITY